MKIAVSMREVECPEYREPRDAISQDWMKYLSHFDVLPFLIPNSFTSTDALLNEIQPDVIILTNGEHPSVDKDENTQEGSLKSLRDAVETQLLEYAIANRIPVLGVCRGLQFIQVYFGGKYPQMLSDSREHLKKHVNNYHSVKTYGIFRSIVQSDNFEVNSFHRYGVKDQDLASDLEYGAISDDGVVEACYHSDLPILAIQWHPERPSPTPKHNQLIFRHILHCTSVVTQ